MFARVFLSLVALSFVVAEYPISSHGCQCQGPCEKNVIGPVVENKCQVTSSICTDATDGMDKCVSRWSTVTGFLSKLYSGTKQRLKAKLSEWTTENVQKLPIDDIKEHFGNASAPVLRKFSLAQLRAIRLADIKEWAAYKLNKFSSSDFGRFTKEQIQSMNVTWFKNKLKKAVKAGTPFIGSLLAEASADQLNIPVDVIKKLSKADWRHLNWASIKKWTKEQIHAIPLDEIKNFTRAKIAKIPVEAIKDFAKEQYAAMKWEVIGGLGEKQWTKVPVNIIASFGWKKIQQVPWEKLANFTKAHWDQIPFNTIVGLSGTQIAKLDPFKLKNFTQEYWNNVPIYHIAHFTAEQLKKTGILSGLDPDKVAHISEDTWKNLDVGSLAELSAEQLKRVDLTAMSHWSKEQWASIKFGEILKLTGKRLRAVPAEEVGKWTKEEWDQIPLHKFIVFSGEQINHATTLAKLSFDKIAAFAHDELDMDLLGDRKAEFEEYLKKKCGDIHVAECMRSRLRDLIFKYDDTQNMVEEYELDVAEIENTPYETDEEAEAAKAKAVEELEKAKKERDAAKTELEEATKSGENSTEAPTTDGTSSATSSAGGKTEVPTDTTADPEASSVGQLTVGIFVALTAIFN